MDVINQTWSPMYNLINIFDVFLPQLLLYPNPTDPLNGEAAQLMMHDKDKYDKKVRSLLVGICINYVNFACASLLFVHRSESMC